MKKTNILRKEAKKQLRFWPGYVLLLIWLTFTVAMIGWIVLASFSTTREIFSNEILHSGFHFENYANVLSKHKMSVYFINSIIYCVSGCAGIILVSAPAAYVSMSIPSVMLILPLFKMATSLNLIGSRWTLIILYICINVPFGVFFLIGFFASLPKALEEAAEIDGCTPDQAFWKIMFPLAQPGIMTLTIFNFIIYYSFSKFNFNSTTNQSF